MKNSYQRMKEHFTKEICALEKRIREERLETVKIIFTDLPKIYKKPHSETRTASLDDS